MRAHQIMTRSVVTVAPDSTILEAANIMLRRHVSGLPVLDAAGKLVGSTATTGARSDSTSSCATASSISAA